MARSVAAISVVRCCVLADGQAPAAPAEAAYDYFDSVGRSSEYGRIVNERNSH